MRFMGFFRPLPKVIKWSIRIFTLFFVLSVFYAVFIFEPDPEDEIPRLNICVSYDEPLNSNSSPVRLYLDDASLFTIQPGDLIKYTIDVTKEEHTLKVVNLNDAEDASMKTLSVQRNEFYSIILRYSEKGIEIDSTTHMEKYSYNELVEQANPPSAEALKEAVPRIKEDIPQDTLDNKDTAGSPDNVGKFDSHTVENNVPVFDTELGRNPIIVNPLVHQDEFALMLQIVGKCFYNLQLTEDDYQRMAGTDVESAVNCILDYRCQKHIIPEELQYAFGLFWQDGYDKKYPDVYKALGESYFSLEKNILENKWQLTCNRSLLGKFTSEGCFVDMDGNWAVGVQLYQEDDNGAMVPVYEIVDFAKNVKVQGAFGEQVIKDAVLVRDLGLTEEELAVLGDEPYWKDLNSMLNTNKELVGEPAYYVEASDPHRP